MNAKLPGKLATLDPPLEVLLVEDEEEIRKMVRLYLEGRGMVVREAADGEAAWDDLQKQVPDVLLSDVLLPRLSGRELAARLHLDTRFPGMPVALMSASLFNAKDEAALKSDSKVEAVFRKPLALREVAATLVELGLARRRAKAQQGLVRTATGTIPAAAIPATPAPAPVRTATGLGMTGAPQRTQTYTRMGAFGGEADPRALAAVASRAFQERLDGVLEVVSGGHTRRILFHDGIVVGTSSTVEEERLGALLVESGLITDEQANQAMQVVVKEGVRFGFAVVRLAGLPPSAVAQALEEQTLWVAMQALTVRDGDWALKPMQENPVLAMQARLDPVEAVQRAALECLGDEEARELVLADETPRATHLLLSQVFAERALSFSALRPTSQLVRQLMDEPTLRDAIARAESVPSGLKELAALVLSGAFMIASPGEEAPMQKRPPVLGSFGGRWRPPGLPAADVELRESIALEWLRSGGRKPHEILCVEANATPAQVQQAVVEMDKRFGPQALDSKNLGPAKRFLHVVRARFFEAARLMGG